MLPKRVLLVNPWSSCHGGTSMVLLEFVKHLDRSRFEPVVLCPKPGELTERLEEIGVPYVVHRLPGLTKEAIPRFLRESFWYWRWLRGEGFDLIHLNGPKWKSCIAWAARLCRIPLVVHVHNPARHVEKNFSLRWAQRIMPVSDAVGQSLYQSPLYKHRTLTLHNGVELDRFAMGGPDHRSKITFPNQTLIGFVGQIVPRKGLVTLLKAMPQVLARHTNVRLLIVGCAPSGEEAYESECRILVKQLQIENHVEFLGFKRDVDRWMRTFDLFVLPTRSEPFGKVIIEAMTAGCPVIASRVGGIPEIIQDEKHGTLIPPDDPGSLATAILEYLDNPDRRESVSKAGCQHVRENFSIEAMITKLESVYTDVINGHGKAVLAK